MASLQTIPGNILNEKVEQITFDLPSPQPIKGFPELRWAGKRPFTSTYYFPAQLKEQYGDPVDGWMNRIYWGDNLQVMSHLLKEFRGKVDLVYIDPPFDSKADYKKQISLKGAATSSNMSSFEEKQYADIWTNDEYLQFIYERLILIKELLSINGSIIVHCDWHKSHYIRSILDEIFGQKSFINEIIWHYYNKMQGNIKHFAANHDVLIWYSKGHNFIFNKIQELRDKPITQIKRVWDSSSGKLVNAKDEQGNIIYIESTHKTVDDVWKISMLQPADNKEPLGYPTQKPEKLISRVIEACSKPGGLILDCFMGSGTTQAVAMKLGRRFIGADINLGAIQTSTKRLNSVIEELKENRSALGSDGNIKYLNFEVYNVNNYDIFRNPVQARELLLQALEIEPLQTSETFDGVKDGYKVKIMPVNRIATRADLNPIISGINYRELDKKLEISPGAVHDRIMLVCMGHEPDLAAHLQMEIGKQYRIEVKVVDILREKERGLTFKYDSEADIAVEDGELIIKQFYPRNLLQKLSLLEENVEEWRELVETVAIDWNYNGEVLSPAVYDNPGKNELVQGRYAVPEDHGIIRVKITDLLSESLEMSLEVE